METEMQYLMRNACFAMLSSCSSWLAMLVVDDVSSAVAEFGDLLKLQALDPLINIFKYLIWLQVPIVKV
jgi:hypothetical protein